MRGSQILQYVMNGLSNGCIYILIAMGFNIIFSSTGVINFAQGEFSMFGGLLFFSFAVTAGLPVALAVCLAILLTGMIGAATERLVIYPLRHLTVLVMIIATVGASILFKAVGRLFWPMESNPVPQFTSGQLNFLGITVSRQMFWVFGLTALAVAAIYYFYNRTRTGMAMQACSINRQAACLMGINVQRMSMYAFFIAALLGGLAGLVNANAANYHIGFYLGIRGFTAAVIGGLGNVFGAVVGGLSLGLLEELTAGLISSGYRDLIAAVVLIAILLVRPQGLTGKRRTEKV
ncbi:MAG: branched-chain amino acid ABC transporter permease [Candidatus Geothermincolia bacterium]